MRKIDTGYPSIDKPWLQYYTQEAIETPLPACTLYDNLWHHNKDYLNNVALNYFGRKITFQELFEGIEAAAKAFTAIGVGKGDIVVMATVTTPETVYAFYALNRLGAIANMVDPRTGEEGIREYILEVNAKHLLVVDVASSKIAKAIAGTNIQHIIITSPGDSLPQPKKFLYFLKNRPVEGLPSYTGVCYTWARFTAQGVSVCPSYPFYQPDTCCVIVHTGGTTGSPKGVMLSNDNVNALVEQSIRTGIDMKREHTWLDIMPPFIAYGIGMGLHLPLTIGMETILVPSFDAKKFDQLLLKHKANHMVGVPSYWGTVIQSRRMQGKNLSWLIAPTVGGDTMNIELEQQTNDFLADHHCSYKIVKGYGMTEVCAGVTGTVDANNEPGSVGIPFVQSVVSVFHPETGEELKYGEAGEICISGPNVMLGYYRKKEATEAIVKIHSDGTKWVHSGDMGYMNERGSLFVLDRMKRMIVRYDGFKVFPSMIEKTIMTHPGVEACCVVGTPDLSHSQGKLPVVYLVTWKNEKERDENIVMELQMLCRKEIPDYAQPVAYYFCEALPLTTIGKIDYRKLEEDCTL